MAPEPTLTEDETVPKSEAVRLSASFISDAQKRRDVLVLYAFLEAIRDIPRRVSDPLLGQIRLRWWYEAFDEIAEKRPVRHHPLAIALNDIIGRYDLDASAFQDVIEGQGGLLEAIDLKAALAAADAGEGGIARLAAQIIDPTAQTDSLLPPARLWGLAQLKPRETGEAELNHALRDAKEALPKVPLSLLPLVLPAVLAPAVWRGKPKGPLSTRFALLKAYFTGKF